MAVAASDIIARSLKALGALGATEVPSAGEATDALVAFNAMLDSWSNEGLMSYEVLENSVVLTINKASYTIGSGGDIAVTRPLDITQAYIQDSNSNNFLMDVVPRDKWNQIGNRGSTVTSQIPDTLFYDSQSPLGVINLFPTPLLAYTLFFDYTLDQTNFALLTTTLAMPKGYELAYVTNLALLLMTVGFECTLKPETLANLIETARQSKANVKRTNIKEVISNYDPAIVSRSYASYNIYRDR